MVDYVELLRKGEGNMNSEWRGQDFLTFSKAIKFCIQSHGNQVRKYTGEPYWHHPVEVSNLLRDAGVDDINLHVAALLHDVVEDTEVTVEDIRQEFYPLISNLVEELTDVSVPEDGIRLYRKALDRMHLAKASQDAQVIKLADLISNAKSISLHDEKFAVTYFQEISKLYPALTKALGSPVGRKLYVMLGEIITEYYAKEARE